MTVSLAFVQKKEWMPLSRKCSWRINLDGLKPLYF
jgi:hypothetical protein